MKKRQLRRVSLVVILAFFFGACIIPLSVCAAEEVQQEGVDVVESDGGENSGRKVETIEQMGRVILYLGILAAVAFAAMQFMKRGGRQFLSKSDKNGSRLRVCDTHMLGNKQFLVVVEYEGVKILLGVGPGMINKLCYLNRENTETPPEAS